MGDYIDPKNNQMLKKLWTPSLEKEKENGKHGIVSFRPKPRPPITKKAREDN